MYSVQFNPSYLSNKRYAQSEIFRGLMFHDVQLFTSKIDSNFDVHETGDFRPVFAVILFFISLKIVITYSSLITRKLAIFFRKLFEIAMEQF